MLSILGLWLQGMVMSIGLIAPIGAQNAYVIKNGIMRNHTIAIGLVCFGCDAIFMTIGMLGVGSLFAQNEVLSTFLTLGGIIFIIYYGFNSFRIAWNLKENPLTSNSEKKSYSKNMAVLGALLVTLLNPHFYLDTIVLLGSLSSQFASPKKYIFWIGAVSGSFVWFCFLSLVSRWASGFFTKVSSWRILEIVVGLLMWSLAIFLLKDLFSKHWEIIFALGEHFGGT